MYLYTIFSPTPLTSHSAGSTNFELMNILILLISLVILYYGVTGLKTGKVYITGMRLVPKEDFPFTYWVHTVLYIMISLKYAYFTP